MSNFKHSKLRNTGLLFEFLLRQVTVDVLNKQKNSKALKLIKKSFNEHTEVGKELSLYTALMNKKFKSDKKADYFVNEVLRQRQSLNNSQLKREKYNIVKEISTIYNSKNLFSSKVNNYVVYASIYKLFEGINTISADEKTESYFNIVEQITTKTKVENKSFVPTELDNDVRVLSYRVLLEKFNKKYTNLSKEQKTILKEYINNISNTNNFYSIVEKKLNTLKGTLSKKVPKVKDKVLKIKLNEAINCMDKFCVADSKTAEDKSVIQLLRYYELNKELSKI